MGERKITKVEEKDGKGRKIMEVERNGEKREKYGKDRIGGRKHRNMEEFGFNG